MDEIEMAEIENALREQAEMVRIATENAKIALNKNNVDLLPIDDNGTIAYLIDIAFMQILRSKHLPSDSLRMKRNSLIQQLLYRIKNEKLKDDTIEIGLQSNILHINLENHQDQVLLLILMNSYSSQKKFYKIIQDKEDDIKNAISMLKHWNERRDFLMFTESSPVSKNKHIQKILRNRDLIRNMASYFVPDPDEESNKGGKRRYTKKRKPSKSRKGTKKTLI